MSELKLDYTSTDCLLKTHFWLSSQIYGVILQLNKKNEFIETWRDVRGSQRDINDLSNSGPNSSLKPSVLSSIRRIRNYCNIKRWSTEGYFLMKGKAFSSETIQGVSLTCTYIGNVGFWGEGKHFFSSIFFDSSKKNSHFKFL